MKKAAWEGNSKAFLRGYVLLLEKRRGFLLLFFLRVSVFRFTKGLFKKKILSGKKKRREKNTLEKKRTTCSPGLAILILREAYEELCRGGYVRVQAA